MKNPLSPKTPFLQKTQNCPFWGKPRKRSKPQNPKIGHFPKNPKIDHFPKSAKNAKFAKNPKMPIFGPGPKMPKNGKNPKMAIFPKTPKLGLFWDTPKIAVFTVAGRGHTLKAQHGCDFWPNSSGCIYFFNVSIYFPDFQTVS